MARVLVACEESQEVTKAFRALGHEAYSCDLQECSGGHPEWHICKDVSSVLLEEWDLVIAHPPCTYLAMASASYLYTNFKVNPERYELGLRAREFFMMFLECNCPRVAVENPTPLKIYKLPEKSQVIQPYQFGEPFSKRTYLWLKNLPLLQPTNIVSNHKPYIGTVSAKHGSILTKRCPKVRSRTFPGIAKAMAKQWGALL
jgi:hypothetical protein